MSLRERWWIPLTTSTVTVSPLLMVLGVFVSMSNSGFTDPYWLDLSSKATVSVLFLAPGFAALGAWDAAGWKVLTDGAVRSWVELLVRHVAFVALATAVTFAIALVLLLGQHTPTVGWPRLDVLALGVWVTCCYSALGFVLGRFLSRLVAAPVAFAVVWLWVAYTPAVQPFWLRNVTGSIGTSCCSMDSELVPFALAAPAVLTGALVVAAALILSWPDLRVVWAGSGLLIAGAVTVSGSLMANVGADPVQPRTGDQVCIDSGGTTFCAWPEHGDTLRVAGPILSDTVSRLRDAGLDVPSTLHETQRANGWSFSLNSNSPHIWSGVLATSRLDDAVPDCAELAVDSWEVSPDDYLASAWLDAIGGLPEAEAADKHGVMLADLQGLLASSEEDQLAWFLAAEAAMRSCDRVN